MIPAGRPPKEPRESIICRCMCAVIHPDRALCNGEAPSAMVSFDTTGMKHQPTEGNRREVVMCAPCAKATVRVHPRAADIVILEVRKEAQA